MRQVSCLLVLLGLVCEVASAGPIKDFTTQTDVLPWTKTNASGAATVDAVNTVSLSTVASYHRLLVSNAQLMSGTYSFTFQISVPTGVDLILDRAELSATPTISPGGTATSRLLVSAQPTFSEVFADVDAFTTGELDLGLFNLKNLYFRVDVNAPNVQDGFLQFELVARSSKSNEPPAVPEPSTYALLSMAAALLIAHRSRAVTSTQKT
jgi:hypothetical protein